MFYVFKVFLCFQKPSVDMASGLATRMYSMVCYQSKTIGGNK
jgi:hypothetical protein